MDNMDSEWEAVKHSLSNIAYVKGVVIRHAPFGYFVKIDGVDALGLVQITDVRDAVGTVPSDFPNIGDSIVGRVLGFKEHEKQVWLGTTEGQMHDYYTGRPYG